MATSISGQAGGSSGSVDKDKSVHFAKYFTTKDGRKIWAEDYGYDAWPIPVGGNSGG